MAAPEKDLFVDKSAAALEEETRKLKRLKDYWPDVEKVATQALSLFNKDNTKYNDAIALLLPWEKKARLTNDVKSTKHAAATVLDICFRAKQYKLLSDQFTYFIKARSQLVLVIKTLTMQVLSYAMSLTSDDIKLDLLSTVITVSEGRLSVEYEWAMAIIVKSRMLYDQGKKQESYDTLISIPVEVIGSMTYEEKSASLLNQARLGIMVSSIDKASQTLKKVRVKELTPWPRLQHQYHILSTQIALKEKSFIDAAKHFLILHKLHSTTYVPTPDDFTAQIAPFILKSSSYVYTPDESSTVPPNEVTNTTTTSSKTATTTKKDDTTMSDDTPLNTPDMALSNQYLQLSILSATLAPSNYESKQFILQLLSMDRAISKTGTFEILLNKIASRQMIQWPIEIPSSLPSIDTALVEQTVPYYPFTYDINTTTDSNNKYTIKHDDPLYKLFYHRILQHNIYILSLSYTQITIKQATTLLHITDDTFEEICQSIAADYGILIDRRYKTIVFTHNTNNNTSLETLTDHIITTFSLIDSTTQLIRKEKTLLAAAATSNNMVSHRE